MAHEPRPPQSTSKRPRTLNPNNTIYANPLPLLVSRPVHALGFLPLTKSVILNPKCVGVYDSYSRSVWIINMRDTRILWERGFFGKGNLSRSEPSWLRRRMKQLSGEEVLTAEEVTARRREQRKQFKNDRARAIAKAAADAEAAFAANRDSPKLEVPVVTAPHNVPRPVFDPGPAAKKTIKVDSAEPPAPSTNRRTAEMDVKAADRVETGPAEVMFDGEIVPDMEHLQLTLQEAFFLAWSLGCLRILDHSTGLYMSLPTMWSTFLSSSAPSIPSHLPCDWPRRTDNPFLLHYVVYHHYRSLGWVVRGGIKFCVDYLLYKRGPVFQHAEFAVVICPSYEDPSDAETSPFGFQTQPFTWTWLSTINRVNSQVKKTLILAYVTVPSLHQMDAGALSSPKCLKEYSVREVVIRRFVPARMRD